MLIYYVITPFLTAAYKSIQINAKIIVTATVLRKFYDLGILRELYGISRSLICKTAARKFANNLRLNLHEIN